jgi:hypothetical protein
LGEKMMNRRSFFKFLPVAPVVLITEGARAVTADQAPENPYNTLALAANKKSVSESGGPVSEAVWSKSVSIAVGEDGKLWVRSKNEEWRRVVTE